jgi:hypothetical protein
MLGNGKSGFGHVVLGTTSLANERKHILMQINE